MSIVAYTVVFRTSPLNLDQQSLRDDSTTEVLTLKNKRWGIRMFAWVSYTPGTLRILARIQWSGSLSQVGRSAPDAFARKRTREAHTALQEHTQNTKLMIGTGFVRQAPPEKAIKTLNALVLFSVLSSAFSAFRIPIMMTRMMISPREQTVNEMLDIRFRDRDAICSCSGILCWNSR